MKSKAIVLLCAFLLAAFPVFFLGCSGCASKKEDKAAPAVSADRPAGGAHVQGQRDRPPEILPAPSELSAEALDTYAYLVFASCMYDEDEKGLFEARELMKQAKLPAKTWMEGGVWLLGLRSPHTVPFLEDAHTLWPDDASLNLLYAEALISNGGNGGVERGIALIRAYLQKNPDSLDARLELALLLVKNKEFMEAEDLLGSIPAKKRTPLVNYYFARALIGMQRQSEALPLLQAAVKEQPDFVEALAELAFVYEQRSNLPEARKIYERILKLDVASPDVLLRLINISLRLQQPEKALKYMRQGPDTKQFRLTVAGMFMDFQHALQAENILKKIAAEGDKSGETYILLADVMYQQRRDLTGALSWLDKVPLESSHAGQAQLLRARILAEAGRGGQALEEARRGQQKFTDISDFWEMEIRILAHEKKVTEALDAARKAIEIWPQNSDLLFLFGALLDETGDKKDAFRVMETILESHPDNFQALNYVGYTLTEENHDLDRALKLIARANQLSPNKSYIVDSLAWALFKVGRAQEALVEIRRAVELGGQPDSSIWEHYGDIAHHLNLKDEARKAYQNALDLKPANAESLRRRLSQP
ncbi:MAG: tetratricopeptide repeat protein [Desulfovibrio sp.]|jgi:tetratricopeptide (TPR) repeat protein|nr:tetratricopeptide repeat protein [Desulfovibrio sp.]